jgi:hypothetical protein
MHSTLGHHPNNDHNDFHNDGKVKVLNDLQDEGNEVDREEELSLADDDKDDDDKFSLFDLINIFHKQGE